MDFTYQLFQQVLTSCNRKRKATHWPQPQKKKLQLFVPVRDSVDYTKSALQKQTETCLNQEQALIEIIKASARLGLSELKSSVDVLEKLTSCAKAQLMQASDSWEKREITEEEEEELSR
jgi:hypothetical protein